MAGSSIRRWEALVVVACVAARPASADSVTVVFESYDGSRPSALAQKHVAPLLAKLEESDRAGKWRASPASVLSAVGGRLPRNGNTDPTMTVPKIRAQFVKANSEATGLGYDLAKAVASYELGFRWVRENPALVITDYEARKWLTEAYVGYVAALDGDGHEDKAKRAAEAQVLSFPELVVSPQGVGPTAARPFDRARHELERAQKGLFLISIADRVDASVAINYVPRGRGSSFQINAVRRPYDVLVQVGNIARRYEYQPEPTRQPHDELRIEWELDSRLEVSEHWVGLERATPNAVHHLTQKLIGHNVATISLVDRGGRRWLVGTRYAAGSSHVLTRCVAEVGTPAETAMAPCLLGGVRLDDAVYSEIPAPPHRSGIPAQWPMWMAFGGMLGSTAAGMYFVSEHAVCGENCTRRTMIPSAVSVTASASLLVLTTYLYLRRDGALARARASRRGLAFDLGATPDGGGIMTFTKVFE
ncbi:MAG: hypothetical protein KIT31_05325 [Deltaproteobacteria bacterium]|nr:hypothetical protein [Deltaproteobacteria bacterium]